MPRAVQEWRFRMPSELMCLANKEASGCSPLSLLSESVSTCSSSNCPSSAGIFPALSQGRKHGESDSPTHLCGISNMQNTTCVGDRFSIDLEVAGRIVGRDTFALRIFAALCVLLSISPRPGCSIRSDRIYSQQPVILHYSRYMLSFTKFLRLLQD